MQAKKRKAFTGLKSFKETHSLFIFFPDASRVRLIAKQAKRRNLFEL